ncbi:MAG: IS110 family transposase [Prevotellaceae bacterium]|nr:IS110 family transposase [Prevotellaceae bacterium]
MPNLSKNYGKSLGHKSKTDKIDAMTLAQMGLGRSLRERNPQGCALKELRQLSRKIERILNKC